MKSFILTIAYKGTNYCGWQVQPSKPTVQGTLQAAIEKVFGISTELTGCSRTDAGVHAKGFVATVAGDFPSIPAEALPLAVNAALPEDIAVINAAPAPEGFHPRYDALGKEYVYTILNRRIRDPFCEDTAWLFPREIHIEKAQNYALEFVGKKDFRAFMASGSKIIDTTREIKYFTVEKIGDTVCFRVYADGFLYNMVRIMVGTIAEKASGTEMPSVTEIINSRDRALAGTTAPAKGLCLNKVFY